MTEKNNAQPGKPYPEFYARTSKGEVNFPGDFKGKWVVLYSYIGDFLPADATDILALDKAKPKFFSYNADVIAMSPDSVATHIAWVRSLRNQRTDGTDIDIELISDRNLEISQMLGITNADGNMNNNAKAVYIIDSNGILRSSHIYSHNTGINVTDIERELLALQTAQFQTAHTPVNWTPGEDVLDIPPQTVNSASTNVIEKEANGSQCLDWYICYRQDNGNRRP